MTTEHVEKKERIVKLLAITGFIAIISVIAWLAVSIVSFVPNAFSSLASLADGIKQYQESVVEEEITEAIPLSLQTTLTEPGQPFVISWVKDQHPGSYTFSYNCLDGLSVDILLTDGLRTIECATKYELGDTDNVTIIIESNLDSVSDLAFEITYQDTIGSKLERSGVGLVQVNKSNLLAETETAPEPIVEGTATSPAAPTPPAVVTPPRFEYTYTIPTSNPNGVTDLGVRFINIGEIRNGTFVTRSPRKESSAAIQFEIKNLGTKTSRDWTFKVTTAGDSYESETQSPLKPNERAIISISFDTVDSDRQNISVSVEESTDRNPRNDSFRQTINLGR